MFCNESLPGNLVRGGVLAGGPKLGNSCHPPTKKKGGFRWDDVRIFMMIQTTKSSPDQSVKGHFWFIDVLMLIARKTHLHCNQKTRYGNNL